MTRRSLLGSLGFLAASLLAPVLAGCSGSTSPNKGGRTSSKDGDKDKPELVKPPRRDPGD